MTTDDWLYVTTLLLKVFPLDNITDTKNDGVGGIFEICIIVSNADYEWN